jgi:nucleoside-diphosphate-sugar epimerase
MSPVMVTGGSGYVGTQLIAALLRAGGLGARHLPTGAQVAAQGVGVRGRCHMTRLVGPR